MGFRLGRRAPPLYTPWLKPENCKAGLIGLRGTVSPAFGLMERHAKEIASLIKEAGVHKMPVGVDIIEPPMMFELEKAGLKIVDGQQVMLEARELKNIDEIALLNRSAAMVDGAYHLINEELKPGIRENDIVAKVNEFLYRHGSDDVEAINAISGERCNPHPHNFTDRMLRPGDQAFFDILQSFMGYRTTTVPSMSGGQRRCSTTPTSAARVARQRDRADQAGRDHRHVRGLAEGARFGFPDEMSAFGLQFGHGLGLALHERPIISRGLARPSDRDQGGHGVRARDLLPRRRRLLRRPHRGGGRGDRQGLPRDHAVPGGGAADQPPVLIGHCVRHTGRRVQRVSAPLIVPIAARDAARVALHR